MRVSAVPASDERPQSGAFQKKYAHCEFTARDPTRTFGRPAVMVQRLADKLAQCGTPNAAGRRDQEQRVKIYWLSVRATRKPIWLSTTPVLYL
jgi:hypothetical protein